MKRGWIIAVLLATALSSSAQPKTNSPPAADSTSSVVGGFSAPSFNRDNLMTSRLFGDFAKIMPNGYAEITGMKVEFYGYDKVTSNRVTTMTVTSPQCVYHRERKAAASQEPVRIERSDMVITGTGFVWENEKEVMQILHNSKVVLHNARRDMKEGIKP